MVYCSVHAPLPAGVSLFTSLSQGSCVAAGDDPALVFLLQVEPCLPSPRGIAACSYSSFLSSRPLLLQVTIMLIYCAPGTMSTRGLFIRS